MGKLMTSRQKSAEAKRGRIARAFLASYQSAPDVSVNRHLDLLARRYDLTTMGVKYILSAEGIYHSNGRNPIITISYDKS